MLPASLFHDEAGSCFREKGAKVSRDHISVASVNPESIDAAAIDCVVGSDRGGDALRTSYHVALKERSACSNRRRLSFCW